jgi:hypothetical protein
MTGTEVEEIDVEELNRKKRLYVYPEDCNPDRIINYCVTMVILPFNYPWGRRIRRASANKIIPDGEEDKQTSIETFLKDASQAAFRQKESNDCPQLFGPKRMSSLCLYIVLVFNNEVKPF